MTERPVTGIDILRFIDGEFRTAARDILELHGLELQERVEKFLCMRVTQTGESVFSFAENYSKFRAGDYVLLNPESPDLIGERIAQGRQCIVGGIDDREKSISLDERGYRRKDDFDTGAAGRCVIDAPVPSRFPLYVYPALASGYLATRRRPGPLIQEILSGTYRDRKLKGPFPDPPHFLLKGQAKAFEHAMRHRLSLIQGPPGTGKTFLIAQIVEALADMGLRVFICAFSHRAINNALNACVRKTSLESVSKVGGEYSNDDLDGLVGKDGNSRVVGMTAYSAFKARAMAMTKKGRAEGHQRPAAPEVRDEAYWQEMDAYTRAVFEAGADAFEPEYDAVVFDEASQMLVHHALMAMPLAERYIFVGDHRQMPPVVQGYHRGNPVNRSVFSLLHEHYPNLTNLLDETRRMNSAITAFPSAEYYEGRLKPIKEVRERRLQVRAMPADRTLASIIDPEAPVVFAHVEHEGYTQESPEEARLVARIVFELVNRCGVDPKDGLCVVAAHRRQNNLIRQCIADLAEREKVRKTIAEKLVSPDLVVDTVERIQGQERDVVIVSLTSSDEEHIKSEKDFLMMPNRMNVSFTRPRSKLIVVGSKKLFRVVPPDRDELQEEVIDGRAVLRSKRVQLTNHFKRWYFHVKNSQRIVEATELAGRSE